MSNLQIQLLKWEPFTRHISWLNRDVRECIWLISVRISPSAKVLRTFRNFLKPYEKYDQFASKTIASLELYLGFNRS